jgi:hypothetical protein
VSREIARGSRQFVPRTSTKDDRRTANQDKAGQVGRGMLFKTRKPTGLVRYEPKHFVSGRKITTGERMKVNMRDGHKEGIERVKDGWRAPLVGECGF